MTCNEYNNILKHKLIHTIGTICFLLVSLFMGCRQETFHIKGNLHQVNVSKVYLIHINPVVNSMTVLDSADVHEGHFSFEGSVDLPKACNIKIGRKTTINLIVENSDIEVTGSIQIPEEIKVTGSKADQEYHNLLQMSESIASMKNRMWAEMIEKSLDKTKDDLNNQFSSIDDSLLFATKQYVESHPTSLGAAYFIYYLYLDRQMDILKLAPIIELFDKSVANSEYLEYLRGEISLYTPLSVGMQAPDFSTQSVKSDTVFTLKQFNDRFLYLDFSASWLKNAKKRNIVLKKLQKTHSGKLQILTIYLDSNYDALEKFTNQNGVSWLQSCSYKYWEDDVTKLYGVTKIPYGVLIDTAGTIIAFNPKIQEFESLMR